MRNYIILGSVFSALLFGTFKGCQMWEASLNKKLLQGHLVALLKHNDVHGLRLSCSMVRNLKVGYCLTRLSTGEVAKLQDKLKLQHYDWERIGRRGEEEIRKWDSIGGCRDVVEIENRPKYNIYKSKRNAPELKLPNGLHFTYMLMYHNPVRGDGCIQASYEEL